ncbi:MAG: thiolase family protein [Deltaproteobacteria bacterium]|nr:thiolase family protein [Deltaproteobacteria bacterium]MBI3296024.1 thiolase family protein [Deltaproteobacteria bacterium]
MEIVFVAAKRTPFGSFGGSFLGLTATDLCVEAAKAAIAQSGVAREQFDHAVIGNVMQTSTDAAYLARHVALRSNLPQTIAAVTVNRLCGSGFEAIADGARRLKLGEAQVVLVGGTESMSQAPFALRGVRFGYKMGHQDMEDTLLAGLTDSFAKMAMSGTAEKLAEIHKISREACDEYSALSHARAAKFLSSPHYSEEVVPVEIFSKKGNVRIEKDEHVRPDCTPEGLKKLRPVFKKDGVITAGNASGMVDGACALVMTTLDFANANRLTVLGRFVDGFAIGCDPSIMGIGPVPAIRHLVEKHRLSMRSLKAVEVNEAFSSQFLAVEKELGLPREITNTGGGAIAIGHPLGASGARLVAHLLYDLKARGGGQAIGSACIGGGQGIAVLIES